MTFNYRILAHEMDDDVTLAIHEVYHNDSKEPNGYSASSATVSGESIEGLQWTVSKMELAFSKPILYAGERFPQIYKEVEK